MPRLKADSFQIASKMTGSTVITFRGEGNREFEIALPSITLMGLAKAIHLAAKQAPVPVLPSRKAGFRKLEKPVGLPVLPEQSSPEEPHRIEIGVTANLEQVVATFTSPETGHFDLMLPLIDAEIVIEGFQKAITAIKHKPAATKH